MPITPAAASRSRARPVPQSIVQPSRESFPGAGRFAVAQQAFGGRVRQNIPRQAVPEIAGVHLPEFRSRYTRVDRACTVRF